MEDGENKLFIVKKRYLFCPQPHVNESKYTIEYKLDLTKTIGL